jgi:hypothetical protein
MRAYHLYCDHWTVFDDDGRNEWAVSPPNKDGKRTVINTATNRAAGTPAVRKVIEAVEQRRPEVGIVDWSNAHKM